MRILVTGAAGFIGMHFCIRVLSDCHDVLGIDNLNPYYELGLKEARLGILSTYDKFHFKKIDISDFNSFSEPVRQFNPEIIVHLAAQAGVRYSIDNPEVYVKSNLVGFANVLELARELKVKHFMYASSSSVYGSRTNTPFKVKDSTDSPISLYAATKKSNEVMAHSYSHLYRIPTTGLRFFTVYGPWGRPDMAYHIFTKHILTQKAFKLFNNGNLSRDFTYIDDVVESMVRLLNGSHFNSGSKTAPYEILNIGRGEPVHVGGFVKTLEALLGQAACYDSLEMQPGDVEITYADTTRLESITGFTPQVSIEDGLQKFVGWYSDYYQTLVK